MNKKIATICKCLTIFLPTFVTYGQGVLVDQGLQPPAIIPGVSYHYDASLGTLLPETGQEFTPSFNSLNFVDVSLQAGATNTVGTFEVAIHSGTITSPILALSNPTILTGSSRKAWFNFPSTVALTSGDLYVLELIQTAGDNNWSIEIPAATATVGGQTIDMSYAGGRLIYSGVPQINSDMIFQEGMVVPEPGPLSLVLFGVATFTLVRIKHSGPPNAHGSRQRRHCDPVPWRMP